MSHDKLLKAVLGEEVFEGLQKALEKLNTRSVVDIQELHSALKIVPKAVMSFLVRELKPMKIHENKEIKLPYHNNAILLVNKDGDDVYHGQITQDGKLAHDFDLVSIPQLAVHLVSNYELYDGMKEDEASEATRAAEDEASMMEHIQEPIREESSSSSEISALQRDLLSEKINVLEAKIDKVMVMLAQSMPQEKVEKSEKKAMLAKISKILSSKSLTKAGIMPTMPKPPSAGTKAGTQGIVQTGFHNPKSAATDMPGHNVHTGVENPYLKVPKPAAGAPKQPTQPKQPKTPGTSTKTTSFTAAKSEGTTKCGDCGDYLIKSGEYVGCTCFKALSQPTLKKTESAVTYTFSSDWDYDSRFALWKTLRK